MSRLIAPAALLTAVVALASPARAGTSAGLAAYWPADEGTGSLLQEVKNDFQDASLVGGGWTLPGKIGAAAINLRGPANGDYAVASNYTKGTTAMSVSVWAKANTLPDINGSALLFNENLFRIRLYDDTSLRLYFWAGSPANWTTATIFSGTGVFTTGAWHHVAWTVRDGTATLYLDGDDVGTTPLTSLEPSPYPQLGMGVELTNGSPPLTFARYWDGGLDDIAVWTRTLSDTEIGLLYDAGAGRSPLDEPAAVPEPAALAVFGVLFLALRRKRSL